MKKATPFKWMLKLLMILLARMEQDKPIPCQTKSSAMERHINKGKINFCTFIIITFVQ